MSLFSEFPARVKTAGGQELVVLLAAGAGTSATLCDTEWVPGGYLLSEPRTRRRIRRKQCWKDQLGLGWVD